MAGAGGRRPARRDYEPPAAADIGVSRPSPSGPLVRRRGPPVRLAAGSPQVGRPTGAERAPVGPGDRLLPRRPQRQRPRRPPPDVAGVPLAGGERGPVRLLPVPRRAMALGIQPPGPARAGTDPGTGARPDAGRVRGHPLPRRSAKAVRPEVETATPAGVADLGPADQRRGRSASAHRVYRGSAGAGGGVRRRHPQPGRQRNRRHVRLRAAGQHLQLRCPRRSAAAGRLSPPGACSSSTTPRGAGM